MRFKTISSRVNEQNSAKSLRWSCLNQNSAVFGSNPVKPRQTKKISPQQGFSLLELLLVMIILIILTTLSASRFTSSGSKRVNAQCVANLQKIYLAMTIYANDNKGAFPFLKNAKTSEEPLSLLVPKSTTETEMFICPGSGDAALPEAQSFANRRISYAYYMGRTTNDDPSALLASDEQINTLSKLTGQQIFSPTGKWPGKNHDKDGGNLLFCSGAVQKSGPKASRDYPCAGPVVLLNPSN
jgi:prepilin-type N-terminal cleavage/methylation domain-containing protein